MMFPDAQPARDRTAIALSVAVHFCAFLMLAATVRPAFLQLSEQTEDAPIFTISVAAPRVAPHPRPKPAIVHAAVPVTHVIKVAVRLPHPQPVTEARHARTPVVRKDVDAIARPTLPHAVDARAVEPRPKPQPAVAVATTRHDASPVTVATPAAAAAAATAAPAATPTPFAFGDPGLFGQNYRPVPNPPNAIDAIAARLAAHFHIRVLVDENGRATDVKFLPPMPDSATVDELRTKLLAMTYVPADCNGLRCSGDLDLRY